MERLTKRIPNGEAVMDCDSCGLKTSRKCTLYKCRNQLMKRVAAYEDTNLTPEDLNAPFTWQTVLNQASQKALGMEPSRLRELAEADKDGRCVVLPCKVGDTAYYLNGPFIIDFEVIGYQVDERGAWCFQGEHYDEETEKTYYCDPSTEKIGKTVFLTREEAERAMEGRKDD